MQPKFAECVNCPAKRKWDWGVEDWDFGADIDDVEPDEDGGVRGVCPACRITFQACMLEDLKE